LSADPIVILAATRTPLGSFHGAFHQLTASQLGSVAVRAAVERAGLRPDRIEEVIMGNVLSAGQGQAPARQAALGAGVPESVGCTTINKMCGSGMKAVMLAHDLLVSGTNDVMVAGGLESMTNAPYLLAKARAGIRAGHSTLVDHMFLDGLEDAYEKGRLMGSFAEDCASEMGFTRSQQDDFAASSLARARLAIGEGHFSWETAGVVVPGKSGDVLISTDEGPLKVDPSKISKLKPSFGKEGTITPASSSAISDGAAALVLARTSAAERLGVKPLARILGHATFAGKPSAYPTAPIGALRALYAKTGRSASEFDLHEINEAFAVVAMAAMRELRIDHDRLNVHGGACALGHPIGASGARILVTLLGALRRAGARTGAAAVCIGGGEATAIGIELL
jgi:acetyl-CoA C-acetyltransferase